MALTPDHLKKYHLDEITRSTAKITLERFQTKGFPPLEGLDKTTSDRLLFDYLSRITATGPTTIDLPTEKYNARKSRRGGGNYLGGQDVTATLKKAKK